MGSVGDAYDNAMIESFFATLETELLDRVRFKTRREGYQNANSSCRNRMVLVDQATEKVASLNLGHDAHRVDVAQPLRYSKLDPAVRSLGVVVVSVA